MCAVEALLTQAGSGVRVSRDLAVRALIVRLRNSVIAVEALLTQVGSGVTNGLVEAQLCAH